jgi:hypothetical protein
MSTWATQLPSTDVIMSYHYIITYRNFEFAFEQIVEPAIIVSTIAFSSLIDDRIVLQDNKNSPKSGNFDLGPTSIDVL